MKTCPFCAEQIQDDAIKCKFCGEWLKKHSVVESTRDVIFDARNSIVRKLHEIKEANKPENYLYYPSNNKPLEIKLPALFGDKKAVLIYPDKLNFKTEDFFFKNILSILNAPKVHSLNGAKTFIFSFVLLYLDEITRDTKKIDLTKSVGGQKLINTISFGYNYIYKQTYENRLSYYLTQLEQFNFFIYSSNLKIYNNGDIHLKDAFNCNLMTANEKNLIDYGVRTTSFIGVNRSQDPYHFKIRSQEGEGISLLGFKSNTNLEFSVATDNDVFDELIYNRLFQKGTIL